MSVSRTSNGERLTEKIIEFYEAIFIKKVPLSSLSFDFLLLKVNASSLIQLVDKLEVGQLDLYLDTFRALFSHCLLALEKGPALKIQNALQTLHCLLYALCRKKYNDFASEIVNLMCGIDYAETFFNRMFRAILEILSVKCSAKLQLACLRLLIVLCYPSTSFHRNVFMDFLAPFNEQMFNMMCQILSDTTRVPSESAAVSPIISLTSHISSRLHAMLLLTHHVHYQKYDKLNKMNEMCSSCTAVELDCLESGAADAFLVYLTARQHYQSMLSFNPTNHNLVNVVAASVSFAQATLQSKPAEAQTESLKHEKTQSANQIAHSAASFLYGAGAVMSDAASLLFQASLHDSVSAGTHTLSPTETNAKLMADYLNCNALLGVAHVYRMLYSHKKYMVICCKMRKCNAVTGEIFTASAAAAFTAQNPQIRLLARPTRLPRAFLGFLTTSSRLFKPVNGATASTFQQLLNRLCLIALKVACTDPATLIVLHDCNGIMQLADVQLYHTKTDSWQAVPKSQPLVCTVLTVLCEFLSNHALRISSSDDFQLSSLKLCFDTIRSLLHYQHLNRAELFQNSNASSPVLGTSSTNQNTDTTTQPTWCGLVGIAAAYRKILVACFEMLAHMQKIPIKEWRSTNTQVFVMCICTLRDILACTEALIPSTLSAPPIELPIIQSKANNVVSQRQAVETPKPVESVSTSYVLSYENVSSNLSSWLTSASSYVATISGKTNSTESASPVPVTTISTNPSSDPKNGSDQSNSSETPTAQPLLSTAAQRLVGWWSAWRESTPYETQSVSESAHQREERDVVHLLYEICRQHELLHALTKKMTTAQSKPDANGVTRQLAFALSELSLVTQVSAYLVSRIMPSPQSALQSFDGLNINTVASGPRAMELAAAAFASKQPLTEAHVKELLSIARHDLILPTASDMTTANDYAEAPSEISFFNFLIPSLIAQYRYFDFDPACAVGAAGARDSDFHLFSIENDIDKYRVAVESNSVSVVPDQQPSPSAPVSTPSYPFPTPSKAVSVPSSALPASVNKAVVINTQTAETASSGSWGDWASSLLSKATGK